MVTEQSGQSTISSPIQTHGPVLNSYSHGFSVADA